MPPVLLNELPDDFRIPLARDTRNWVRPCYGLEVNLDRQGQIKEWTKILLRFPGGDEPLNPALFLYKWCPDAEDLKERNAKTLFLRAWKQIADQKASGSTQEISRALCERRDALLMDLAEASQTLRASVVWRMVVGLGNPNPLETSLTLHPQYGIPLVPGSAVKGLTRHWRLWNIGSEIGVYPLPYGEFVRRKGNTPLSLLEQLLLLEPSANPEGRRRREERLNRLKSDVQALAEAGQPAPPIAALTADDLEQRFGRVFRQIFGTRERQGQVRFLDALPLCWTYDVDVMTPHYGEYYQGTSWPTDWLEPNPITFLTVGSGSRFRFDLTCTDGTLAAKAAEWLEQATTDFGVGGKTGAGYGEMIRKDR